MNFFRQEWESNRNIIIKWFVVVIWYVVNLVLAQSGILDAGIWMIFQGCWIAFLIFTIIKTVKSAHPGIGSNDEQKYKKAIDRIKDEDELVRLVLRGKTRCYGSAANGGRIGCEYSNY